MIKTKRLIAISAIIFAVVIFASFLWLVTRGNAVWRIHRNYPEAIVYFDPANSPDPEWSDLVRMFGFRFYGGSDPIGIRLIDESVNFNDFRGMTIGDIHLKHCRIADITPLLSVYRPSVTFQDCDFSSLPADQAQLLERSAKIENVYYIGQTPSSAPHVRSLHEYSLFP